MPIYANSESVDGVDSFIFTELTRAARSGDLARVEELIETGATINAADHDGMTPLLYAAEGGHVHVAKALIEADADIHAVDRHKVTSLMLAVESKSAATIQCLLEHRADVNARDGEQRTALMYAIGNKGLFAVDALVRAGAYVNVADGTGMPALMQASIIGEDPIMERLLHAGAQYDAHNASGSTALMYAVDGEMEERSEPVSLLISFGAKIDAVDGYGNSALMRAALAGKWQLVEILRAHGAQMDLANHDGITPADVFRMAFQERSAALGQHAPPLVVMPESLPIAPASDPEEDEAEHDVGCALYANGANDVLNQAFDDTATIPHQHPETAPAPALVGMHFESR